MSSLRELFSRVDRKLTKKAWARFAWYALLLLLAVGCITLIYWDGLSTRESESATIRNLAFVVLAPIGLALAIWRGAVADRQADTAQYSLLNERYQKGAEMLGSGLLSVRLGGIYALKALAKEHPKHYHVRVMQLLCAFVRHPPAEENKPVTRAFAFREDIRAAMQAIGERNESHITLERDVEYTPELQGADLRKLILNKLNFSKVNFLGADFSDAVLFRIKFTEADCLGAHFPNAKLPGADFSGATLLEADLSGANLMGGSRLSDAHLTNANLTDANVAGAEFTNAVLTGTNLAGTIFYKDGLLAEGLTQRQIAFATAKPANKPPILDGLTDPETGTIIAWSKRPTKKQTTQ